MAALAVKLVLLLLRVSLLSDGGLALGAEDLLQVGFGACEITPPVSEKKPVWLAGYAPGRKATGVHDPLYARCAVLRSGQHKIVLVSVDLVGLQYPAVRKIRAALDDFDYVMVSSTHNHEGPDVVGIWGRSIIHCGVDDDYIRLIVGRVTDITRLAEDTALPVNAAYGTAEDETLLRDSRQPFVKDAVLRAIRFERVSDGKTAGLLVQWNCHPEALGSGNTLISADFPAATVAKLNERYGCPVVYFTGAVGGLMAPPHGRIRDDNGNLLGEGDYEYARRYGEAVADLAFRAVDGAEPISLTPLVVSAKPIALPVENAWYRAARAIGVLRRAGRVWTGDFERLGEAVTPENADQPTGIETEVAYLRLGELHVACIPGEIYPELVCGKVEEPAQPAADYPDAPPEPAVIASLPGEKWMLFGLANDEIGYIIPKRQWDSKPPFAYGRKTSQYGEINSCGPGTAPIIMEALRHRVRDAENQGQQAPAKDRSARQ